MFCSVFPGQAPTTTLDTDERVWGPGYDVFLRATQNKALLDGPPLVSLDSFVPVLNPKTEFWLRLLDVLPNALLAECNLDSTHSKLPDLLKLYHSGIVFVLLHLPSHLQSFNMDIYKTLRDALESQSFWNYNPIRLVSTLLWAVSLHDKADEILETSMPFSADTLSELLPLTEPPDIQEADVFCQEVAIDFVANAMSTGRESQPFLSFLLSTMAWPSALTVSPPLLDLAALQPS